MRVWSATAKTVLSRTNKAERASSSVYSYSHSSLTSGSDYRPQRRIGSRKGHSHPFIDARLSHTRDDGHCFASLGIVLIDTIDTHRSDTPTSDCTALILSASNLNHQWERLTPAIPYLVSEDVRSILLFCRSISTLLYSVGIPASSS